MAIVLYCIIILQKQKLFKMKIITSVITAFTLVLFMASANNLSASHNPEDWKDKIMHYLGDYEEFENELPNKVLVDFILNEKGEFMILSTSNSEFDKWLKSRLNYKRIAAKELQTLKKYTLPLVFERK